MEALILVIVKTSLKSALKPVKNLKFNYKVSNRFKPPQWIYFLKWWEI